MQLIKILYADIQSVNIYEVKKLCLFIRIDYEWSWYRMEESLEQYINISYYHY